MSESKRLSRRALPSGWTPKQLPSGSRVIKRGAGWTAYWDGEVTHLIYTSAKGLVEERYAGKALPPCCA